MTNERFQLQVIDRLARIETRLNALEGGPTSGKALAKTGGLVTAIVILAEVIQALVIR